MGPEHEFSVVNENLEVLPIVDKIIRDFWGRTVNFVEQPTFTFGKELQLHVMEVKAKKPFPSARLFEETMQNAVTKLLDFLGKKYGARLLGTGMHPLLKLHDTSIWNHRHRKIYKEYSKIFNLSQHGWLNIQSFHLNLPYSNEAEGVRLHNLLTSLCTYLPAISASSPISEGIFSSNVDTRLTFYKANQREVPSIVGDVVPEHISSLNQYKKEIIWKYTQDLAKAGAGKALLFKEWVNSRGVIFRFDRKALEVRVMDEQECIKSDVALSCFIRAVIRGLINEDPKPLPHDILVKDFNNIIEKGLAAETQHREGRTAKAVCQYYFKVALENASEEEKDYLWLVKERIEKGNLSNLIRESISAKAQKTDFAEAVRTVYSKLVKCLANNQPYR
jgi:gamma-glutamyl:cysteine ligase YbdK (ATP-grasp superfamily)